jgi:hypothetical protein
MVTEMISPVTAFTPGANGRISMSNIGAGAGAGDCAGMTAIGASLEDGAVEEAGAGSGVDPPPDARGVTAADALLAADVPVEFEAVTVNVYETPLLSPEITQDPLAALIVHVPLPGAAVIKSELGVPPVPRVAEMVAVPSPAIAVGAGGVPGVGGQGESSAV